MLPIVLVTSAENGIPLPLLLLCFVGLFLFGRDFKKSHLCEMQQNLLIAMPFILLGGAFLIFHVITQKTFNK